MRYMEKDNEGVGLRTLFMQDREDTSSGVYWT